MHFEFIVYFIHKTLTNLFRPKHVGKNFVNKIHYNNRSALYWLFIYYESD